MSGWPTVRLEDCTEIVSGATPSTLESAYWDGDICWATPKDLSELDGAYISDTPRKITRRGLQSCAATVLPSESVLLSSRAPIGHVAINTVPMATNQGFKSFVPNRERVYAKFLYHWLRRNRPYLESLGNGATFKEVSKAVVARIEIPLPPLPEQRRIAEILDRADALRAKRRAALARLDTLTQSIFLDMFGDLSTNPKAWPKGTLGEVTEMVTGYPFRSEEYVTNSDSVRLCRGANVLPGRIDWSDLARWPESKTAELADFNLKAGDVVIAMDRPWISEGFKIARVQPEDCPALLVQRVARLRGGNQLPNEFLFHLLNQPAFTRHCRKRSAHPPLCAHDHAGFLRGNSSSMRLFGQEGSFFRVSVSQAMGSIPFARAVSSSD